jgi:hypothetical protein
MTLEVITNGEYILWYKKCFYVRGYKIIYGRLIKTDLYIRFIGKYNILEFSYRDMIKTKINKFLYFVIYKLYINNSKYIFVYLSNWR